MKTETVLLMAMVVLAVYWQTAFEGLRHLLGAQLDLLPSLMVYAALTQGIGIVAFVAVGGGLLVDSLSANPLATSVGPLFLTGLVAHAARDFLVRDQPFAQAILGAAAGLGSSTLSLIILLTRGDAPIAGWGTLWQLGVISIGTAITTPLWFIWFAWLQRTLAYGRMPETTSFRHDREIRRGR